MPGCPMIFVKWYDLVFFLENKRNIFIDVCGIKKQLELGSTYGRIFFEGNKRCSLSVMQIFMCQLLYFSLW